MAASFGALTELASEGQLVGLAWSPTPEMAEAAARGGGGQGADADADADTPKAMQWVTKRPRGNDQSQRVVSS